MHRSYNTLRVSRVSLQKHFAIFIVLDLHCITVPCTSAAAAAVLRGVNEYAV